MDDRGDVASFSHCDVTMTTYYDISTIRTGLHCGNEMPTSSQAMILKSRHLDEQFTDFREQSEEVCAANSFIQKLLMFFFLRQRLICVNLIEEFDISVKSNKRQLNKLILIYIYEVMPHALQ